MEKLDLQQRYMFRKRKMQSKGIPGKVGVGLKRRGELTKKIKKREQKGVV